MRECSFVHLLQELVQAGPVGVALVANTERGARRSPVGQSCSLGDHVDRVDAEAVNSSLKPPVHHVVDGLAHVRILPVQVGLLAGEEVQVILTRRRVELPRGAPEEGLPVVWFGARRCWRCPRTRGAPVIPVAAGGVGAACGLNEPRVLHRRVVDDQVHDDAHPQLVGAGNQRVEGREVTKEGVDVAVVRDVVAVVCLGRAVDGRYPDDVDAEMREVIEARVDAR